MPTSSDSQPMTAAAAVATALLCVVFGGNPVAIKISLTGLGPFTAGGLRFAIAAAVIALWAAAGGRSFTISARQRPALILICLMFTAQLMLFYLGLSRTLASRGALIANVVPFIVLILSHFFIPGDRITGAKMAGMVMGFAGVAVMLGDAAMLSSNLRTGDLIVLAAASLWAGNAVYTKTVIARFDPFQLVLYPMLFAAPLFLMAGWWWDAPMVRQINLPVTAALGYQSLIAAAFGFVAWNTLLSRFGASTLHSFIFIMPVAGVVFGALILDEPLTVQLLLAGMLVTAGIIVIHRKNKAACETLPVGRSL